MKYVQGEVSQLRHESTQLRQESSKLRQESLIIKEQSAGSYSEITQYREEVATLRGAINELRHDFSSSTERLEMEDSLLVRKKNDLESRISRIEQFLALDSSFGSRSVLSVVSSPATADAAASTPLPSSASSTEQQQGVEIVKPPVASGQTVPAGVSSDALFNQGVVRITKEDYPGARQNFQAYIKINPKSPKLADALFYVAECWYGEKWYEKAILEYQVVIEKHTKSEKRAAALYKQGLALEKIGDTVNAKLRFRDVVNVYPSSPEAGLAKKRLGIK